MMEQPVCRYLLITREESRGTFLRLESPKQLEIHFEDINIIDFVERAIAGESNCEFLANVQLT
jgi:hypothetical protein